MRLTVLVDNMTFIDMYYLGEPALSFYIEDEDEKILFDTGYSDIFLRNAEKMGIDLREVDTIVLSHGHNDHTGGLRFLPACVNGRRILAHPDTFLYREDDEGLPIGSFLKQDEVSKKGIIDYKKEPVKLSKRLYYLGQIEEHFDFERRRPIGKKICLGRSVEDMIFDDSALAYKSKEGLFIITGCSHSGICNIVHQAKRICEEDRILGVIGGFHLFENDDRLRKTISYLKENNIRMLYPCHCVSLEAKIAIAKEMRIEEVGVGLKLEID